MRLVLGVLSAFALCGPCHAELLNGSAIEKLLDDTTVYSIAGAADVWRQSFSKSGQTAYVDAGSNKTYGQWMIRGDKYCSVWPPSDRWVCYGVEGGQTTDGKPMVVWISGGDGKRYEGIVVSGDHIDEASPPK